MVLWENERPATVWTGTEILLSNNQTKMQAGKTTTFFYLTIERIFSVEWEVSLSPALADSPAMFQSEPWIQAADQRCVI